MRRSRWQFVKLALIGGAFVIGFGLAFADDAPTPEQKAAPAFPSENTSWINSPPLSLVSLEGKGAVLWFFDQDSPKVRAKWTELYALTKKH